MTSLKTRYANADRPASTVVDPFLARRILAGWSAQAVAVAGGVSLRTAFRWRLEICAVEEIEFGGWVATFALRRTRPPLRLDAWRRP